MLSCIEDLNESQKEIHCAISPPKGLMDSLGNFTLVICTLAIPGAGAAARSSMMGGVALGGFKAVSIFTIAANISLLSSEQPVLDCQM